MQEAAPFTLILAPLRASAPPSAKAEHCNVRGAPLARQGGRGEHGTRLAGGPAVRLMELLPLRCWRQMAEESACAYR